MTRGQRHLYVVVCADGRIRWPEYLLHPQFPGRLTSNDAALLARTMDGNSAGGLCCNAKGHRVVRVDLPRKERK